jgi:hypothetical protein
MKKSALAEIPASLSKLWNTLQLIWEQSEMAKPQTNTPFRFAQKILAARTIMD